MKMAFIVCMVLANTLIAFSQNEKIGLGIKAGIAIPFNAYTEDLSDDRFYSQGLLWRGEYSMTVKADFTAGIFYRFTKKKFYLMAEGMFSRRGAAMKGDAQGYSGTGENTGAIKLLRHAHLYFTDLNILTGVKLKNFILSGGPSFAINFKNTEIIKFKGDNVPLQGGGRTLENEENDFSAPPVDVGLLISVGYLVPFKKNSVLIELRFSQYFLDNDLAEKLRSLALVAGFIL